MHEDGLEDPQFAIHDKVCSLFKAFAHSFVSFTLDDEHVAGLTFTNQISSDIDDSYYKENKTKFKFLMKKKMIYHHRKHKLKYNYIRCYFPLILYKLEVELKFY